MRNLSFIFVASRGACSRARLEQGKKKKKKGGEKREGDEKRGRLRAG